MKNFDLPPGSDERAQVPKTPPAGEAIAAYAAEMSGTDLDLDHALESAGIEHLLKTGRVRTKPSVRRKKFEAAQEMAHKRYGKAFRKLAE